MSQPQEASKPKKPAQVKLGSFLSKNKKFVTIFLDLFNSLSSFDEPTRRVALLFALSFFGVLGVSFKMAHRVWKAKHQVWALEAKRHTKEFEEMVRKHADELRQRESIFTIGNFHIELFSSSAEEKVTRKKASLAEVEIVVLCDNQETREFLEARTDQVKNQITNVLTAFEREELLSREGKKRLKGLILKKLNEWLPHGKIQEVYFTKVLLG